MRGGAEKAAQQLLLGHKMYAGIVCIVHYLRLNDQFFGVSKQHVWLSHRLITFELLETRALRHGQACLVCRGLAQDTEEP